MNIYHNGKRKVSEVGKITISGFSDEIDNSLKIQMDELEKLGIFHIEMRNVNEKHLVRHSLEEVRDIKKELDIRGFKISSVGSPIGKSRIVDNFEPELELFKHTVEIAKILNTEYIRVFSFYIPEGEKPEDYRDEVIARFNKFVEVLKGTDITMLHENEVGIYGDTPERCFDLFKTVNSKHLKGLIDLGNFVKCGVNNNLKAYELLKDEIIYVHVKDASPEEEHFLPIGKGTGMAKEIFTELYKDSRDYFFSIEPHLKYLPVSGPEQFKIATDALKELLYEVTGIRY